MAHRLEAGEFYGKPARRLTLDALSLLDAEHAAGSRLPRHAHERAYFCLNHGGVYSERYGRRERRVRPGMLVFHPAGEVHAETHEGHVRSLNVELDPSLLLGVLECAGPLDQPVEFDGGAVPELGFAMLREYRRRDADSTLAIESLAWEVLAAAARRPERLARVGSPRWLREARELLDQPALVPRSVAELAREAGVHPVHFAASFRRFYGCSPGEYARRRRLMTVMRQLAHSEVSLSVIAHDAGFADQSHLARTFKRFTGMTPSAYRTLHAFKTA